MVPGPFGQGHSAALQKLPCMMRMVVRELRTGIGLRITPRLRPYSKYFVHRIHVQGLLEIFTKWLICGPFGVSYDLKGLQNRVKVTQRVRVRPQKLLYRYSNECLFVWAPGPSGSVSVPPFYICDRCLSESWRLELVCSRHGLLCPCTELSCRGLRLGSGLCRSQAPL